MKWSSQREGTLLPAAQNVNKKSLRASRQASPPPAPALPPLPPRQRLAPVPPPPIPAALVATDAARVPFHLKLTRPPRPDGETGVQRVTFFEENPLLPGAAGCVLALLEPDKPFELWVNGQLWQSDDGDGDNWQGRPCVVLEFSGTSTAAILAMVSTAFAPETIPVPSRDGWLVLPMCPGHALEVRCDGRLLFAEPQTAPARMNEGGIL